MSNPLKSTFSELKYREKQYMYMYIVVSNNNNNFNFNNFNIITFHINFYTVQLSRVLHE
jgi:hypothetical protein